MVQPISPAAEAPAAQTVAAAPAAGAAPGVSIKVPVTVLIPTLNEAKNLPRCLDHLTWADEIVVVDSCSTDDTARIARAYGASVLPFRWNGQWPKKRNWTLQNA